MQLLVMLAPLAAWAYFALALRTPAHGAAMHIRVRHTRSALRWALTGVLGAACGFGFGLWVSFSAIAGSDVDPSQKARILAE